jgi:CRISPR-associated protein Cas5t
MTSLWLRIQAPFAAFRWMQAGVYRATSPVIPPSAAWGLVLNLALIDTRASDPDAEVTAIRADAPPLCLAVGQVLRCEEHGRGNGDTFADLPGAVGQVRQPATAVLYQQLHAYPVGSSGKELAPRTRGAKYWIAPVRREILVGFDCVLGVRGDAAVCDRVIRGLRGDLEQPRYGLPFAGDNNFLIDRIDVLDEPCAARWYVRVQAGGDPVPDSCRLTVAIDRGDSSRTRSELFAPSEPANQPPEHAWTWCPREPLSP